MSAAYPVITITPSPITAIDNSICASMKEIKALRLFVSPDTTQEKLSTLWIYRSETGISYLACDGHTMALRRSGTHRDMTYHDIQRCECHGYASQHSMGVIPPPLSVLRRPLPGKTAKWYAFETSYIARVGAVEKAAGHRAAADYVPHPWESRRSIKDRRAHASETTRARWSLPSDNLAGFYWIVETKAALWEGVIMPRRP